MAVVSRAACVAGAGCIISCCWLQGAVHHQSDHAYDMPGSTTYNIALVSSLLLQPGLQDPSTP
jgi:hypothetical protein